MPMANQNVRFDAVKTVKKPVTLKFKTKSGKTVFIKALKIERKRVPVRSRSKKK
jgi:hypothetical protein